MKMELSVNSDYMGDHGDPEPSLRHISEAGFPYVHWCHHWMGDYIYSYYEVKKIGRLFEKYHLRLFDLHATHGIEKYWCSTDETSRLSGEELLLNRIKMTADLGGRAIVLHTNVDPLSDITRARAEKGVRTLIELEPVCRELGIRIAVENLFDNGGASSFYDIDRYFAAFPPDYIGFCWDCGHSNMVEQGVARCKNYMTRLTILHMNGNHGKRDEHMPIGNGTENWDEIALMIAGSPYDGALTQEVNMPAGSDPLVFLKDVHTRGEAFADKIQKLRESAR